MCDSEESNFVPDYAEDPPTTHIQGSTLSKKGKTCPVCNGKFTHVRRHVIQEHIPWYMYPTTSCWVCELGFGQERFLRVHIEKEHFDDSSLCRYNPYTHSQRWVEKISTLMNKFKNMNLQLIINSDDRFSICQGSVWQEDDLVHIRFYLNSTNQSPSIPNMPYPVQNFTSMFHWKILCIFLNTNDIHANVQQNINPPANKNILMIGSSIIYWAHQRAIAVNSTDLGLQNCHVSWHGIRGMKWMSFTKTFNNLTQDITPDIVIIHLGSNDISYHSVLPLINKMRNDMEFCMEKFSDTLFIFSELLSRKFWGNIEGWEGENKKLQINKEMGSFLRKRGGKTIAHEKIYWRNNSLFRRDGIHLTEKGNDILLADFKDILHQLC